ncbi:UDP-4-amino-4,6-dideoxy-N-acetyl-beta-L-altrosamine N-acetyltransferase [Glaciecola siphonariae]|uniref:UDP-4-amino-4, 6-dideoxy-N-acetyl-beta-L-altrosamine N-acetyltransferase n=1 Tax=Glaciecola siphonariae TaxID=521012 RepID=A0ABV9LVI0_9ALTE
MSNKKRYPLSGFSPLKKDLLEQVWHWRNKEDVRRNMHNSSLITWDEHLQWFERLQQDNTRRFFIFYQNNRPIGVLNFHQRGPSQLEWGCYLGETKVWPGSGLLLEIAALDYASTVKHIDTLYAEVLSFNTGVLKMHKLFEYTPLPDIEASSQEHTIKVFQYVLADWRNTRSAILAKLPKQIAGAAAFIEFNDVDNQNWE